MPLRKAKSMASDNLKDSILFREEGSNPQLLTEEMRDDCLLSGKYSLTSYYKINEVIDCFDPDIKTYSLYTSAHHDTIRMPYLFEVFISQLLKDFSPELYFIDKLREDINFNYCPYEHRLTVSIRTSFKKKD